MPPTCQQRLPAETPPRITPLSQASRIAVIDAVQAPQRQQVRDRSAADPHEVAAAQALLGVGRGLREDLQSRSRHNRPR